METSRITLDYVDGRHEEFETTTFMCRADRRAFQQHFGRPLSSLRDTIADGKLSEGKDWDEDWDAFFVWRTWARATNSDLSFSDFADSLADAEVDTKKLEQTETPLQAVPGN